MKEEKRVPPRAEICSRIPNIVSEVVRFLESIGRSNCEFIDIGRFRSVCLE